MSGLFGRLFGREEPAGIPGMLTGGSPVAVVPGADSGPDAELRRAMLQCLLDDCWLSELPYGDFVHREKRGRAGRPFAPADCSALMLSWFDAGLVELHQDVEPAEDGTEDDFDYDAADRPLIPPDTARALLAAPERWIDEEPGGWAVPIRTERGAATPADRWP